MIVLILNQRMLDNPEFPSFLTNSLANLSSSIPATYPLSWFISHDEGPKWRDVILDLTTHSTWMNKSFAHEPLEMPNQSPQGDPSVMDENPNGRTLDIWSDPMTEDALPEFQGKGPSRRSSGSLSHGVRTALLSMFIIGCAGNVLLGMSSLLEFSWQPGEEGTPPKEWPAELTSPVLDGQPLVMVFLHPKCPCSRATLDELSIAMNRVTARAQFIAVFEQPDQADKRWIETDIWNRAASITGLTRIIDIDSRLVKTFRVKTSGDTVVYSAEGKLLFHGGLTLGRDHRGENPGRVFVESLASDGTLLPCTSPVFGCPLCASTSPGDSHVKDNHHESP